ncbi:MAG: hypothetical protein U1E60_31040 [Reyranellaceae bacterium]
MASSLAPNERAMLAIDIDPLSASHVDHDRLADLARREDNQAAGERAGEIEPVGRVRARAAGRPDHRLGRDRRLVEADGEGERRRAVVALGHHRRQGGDRHDRLVVVLDRGSGRADADRETGRRVEQRQAEIPRRARPCRRRWRAPSASC